MKKWLVAAAALALVATASPALVTGAQAQMGPPKSPFCNLPKASNNGYAADESWADYYNCWGWPYPYVLTHHEWAWAGPHEWYWGPHRWWWHHHHHWYWRHHHHHHQ
jgi:hypothetical protein